MGVEDPVAAFCLNRATAMWGQRIEDEMEKATEGKKNKTTIEQAAQVVLHRYLGTPMKFAIPTATRR